MWTRFMDMHSGGDLKEPPFARIYIEAPEDEAKRVFQAKFGHNPERVSCSCCGPDYSISEDETLEQISGYDRNLPWIKPTHSQAFEERYLEVGEEMPYGWQYSGFGSYRRDRTPISLDAWLQSGEIKIIRATEITNVERMTDLPEQGWVWRD